MIGGASGGIWRSTDGGATFVPVTDNQVDLAVGSIVFSPSNPSIVYAGMGDPNTGVYLGSGVLKSIDAGRTWTRVSNNSLSTPGSTARIDVDPANPNRVYLSQFNRLLNGQSFSSGFWISTDGGVNWTQTFVGLTRNFAFHPTNSNTIFLAVQRDDLAAGLPAGLYRSTNGGGTWTRKYTTPYDSNKTANIKVAVTPDNSQRVYVFTGGTINGVFDMRVLVSSDGGESFVNRGASGLDPGQFGFNHYIHASPSNADTVYAGTRTATSNNTWIAINSGNNGNGNGTVNYSVAANTGANQRAGTMTIAGQTFTVTQAGNGDPCGNVIPISVGQTVTGQLSAGDCTLNDGSFADLYSFSGTAGQQIAITLNSTAFNAYLFLLNPGGVVIAQDNNGGGTNARIPPGGGFFTLPAAGTYTILANSLSAGETGGYTLALTGPGGTTGLQYYPLPRPIRLFDTRAPIPGFPACEYLNQPLVANGDVVKQARIACDGITIPANAQAIVGNATVVSPAGNGFITLWPNGQARPSVSNLNYTTGQAVPNAFTAGLGADGTFRIYSVASTNFIVDVTGYYAPPGAGGLYYHPLPRPIRLFDTRAPIPGFPACEYLNQALAGDSELAKQARITCDGITIPADAQAIVGNATVVAPSGNGFATLWPNGPPRPPVSNLNYVTGQTVPNAFTVGLGSDGQFRVYSLAGSHFIVDLNGYFAP